MLNKFILAVILSSFYCVLAEKINSSPVLIFSNPKSDVTYDKSGISSTIILSEAELKERIASLGKNQRKIVLVLPDCSPEDLRLKNDKNEWSFANIAKNTKIHDYFPAVKSAVSTLMATNEKKITVELTPNNEFNKDVGDATTIFVRMPACDERDSRFSCLARADRMAYALSKSPTDVLILTSEQNSQIQQSLSRKTRDVDPKATENKPTEKEGHRFIQPNLLAYYLDAWKHPNPKNEKETVQPISFTTVTADKSAVGDGRVDVTFVSEGYKLVLHLFESAGSWSVTNVSVNDRPAVTRTDISAPNSFSFKCSSALFFHLSADAGKEWSSISIRGLQIEARFGDGERLTKFKPAVECVGFTSPAIWTGLFVSFLLLLILTIGITFILDIRSMDRFDDPKGKTITVIASE